MKKRRIKSVIAIGGLVVVAAAVAIASGTRSEERSSGSIFPFTDVKEQTLQFHAFNRDIQLTPEQEAVMSEALKGLKAPCCADKTALTCCCQCNMAKSWWGLSKHLIAERGLGSEEVRTAVREWFEYINPDGFSGDSCYVGRCSRPFHDNGCGGMNEEDIVF
ncbi:MAG: hypothetical protein P8Y44_09040 [Acidobacteriota bacterium]